jgi:hypothetical protein
MTMNIGQLMRGLLGDVQAGDSKALELKVGQIVRGVIMQTMDNNEAIVQINGTQVQAKLETALQSGQSTLLQVQPQSANGTLVLKMVDHQAAAFTDDSVKEWVKALALPDQKWATDLVRDLRRDGCVLTREVAKQFQQAAAAMPKGGDMQQWMQAAALAFKRGLPMTGAIVGALRQSLSGTPAHALLEALEQGLAAWNGASASEEAGSAQQQLSAAQAAAAKLQVLLADGAALMRAPAQEAQPGEAAQQQGSAKPGEAAQQQGSAKPGEAAQQQGSAQPGEAAQQQGSAKPGEAAQQQGSAKPGDAAQQQVVRQGAPMGTGHTLESRAVTATYSAITPETAAVPAGKRIDPGVFTPNAASTQQLPELEGTTENTGAAAKLLQGSTSNWVGQIIKWLGVDHERLLALSTTSDPLQSSGSSDQLEGGPNTEPSNNNHSVRPAQQAAAQQNERGAASILPDRASLISQTGMPLPAAVVQDGQAKAAADTFKSALMTLVSSDDVPQALKDTAQQLVQHVTGQQLLLTPERTSSPFTHVTMFIPMKGPDGGQTASVHIQTRRGRKGELDADNCRLLFDLQMKTLGNTIVDVHVVNKIVSLNLWNDHPAISDLLESSRGEMTQALQGAGFQLLTLRSTPMPDRSVGQTSVADSKGGAPAPSTSEWSAKPYKGVDFRV